jgi:LysR family hydrogen peroxide-inducible transcriptional activator
MLKAIAEAYPDLDLQIRETLTPKLIDGLNEGRLDAAIVALPVSEPAFTEIPLMTESFVLVRPQKDAAKPPPNAEHLREMRLLLLEEGHCFRDQALSFCAMHSAAPRELLDASSLSTLVQLVDSGLGVTLLPDMAVPVETRSAAVSVTRFQGSEPMRTIGMIWRRTNPLTAQLTDMAALIRSATLTLPSRPSPT